MKMQIVSLEARCEVGLYAGYQPCVDLNWTRDD